MRPASCEKFITEHLLRRGKENKVDFICLRTLENRFLILCDPNKNKVKLFQLHARKPKGSVSIHLIVHKTVGGRWNNNLYRETKTATVMAAYAPGGEQVKIQH